MQRSLQQINWVEQSEELIALLEQDDPITAHPLKQGCEAEVTELRAQGKRYVWKQWNKQSRPDVAVQYRLLHELHVQGIAVSRPLGWGMHADRHAVLLTTFDGTALQRIHSATAVSLASLLASIHRMQKETCERITAPCYSFSAYFFPGAERHPDIEEILHQLLAQVTIRQEWLIHGDFHPGNIVEQDGQLTVIDWTNGQMGDPRYDAAWSYVLLVVYVSKRLADVFRDAYTTEKPFPDDEWHLFEAIACLRWVLLVRTNAVPRNPRLVKRMSQLLARHPFLANVRL